MGTPLHNSKQRANRSSRLKKRNFVEAPKRFVSAAAFLLSVVLAVLAFCMLIDSSGKLTRFLLCHFHFLCYLYIINEKALSNVFMVMGIVNFTYPHIVSVRMVKRYGLPLSEVMRSLFCWTDVAYITCTLLVLLGLYASNTCAKLASYTALLGVILSYISTGIIALTFLLGEKRSIIAIELHFIRQSKKLMRVFKTHGADLRRGPLHSKKSSEFHHFLFSVGVYIHDQYTANLILSKNAVFAFTDILSTLPFLTAANFSSNGHDSAFFLYTYSSSEMDNVVPVKGTIPQKAPLPSSTNAVASNASPVYPLSVIESVSTVRIVMQRIFSELEFSGKADLCRKLLAVVSRKYRIDESSDRFNDKSIQGIESFKEKYSPANLFSQNSFIPAVHLLAGIASYLVTNFPSSDEQDAWLIAWDRVFDIPLQVSMSFSADLQDQNHWQDFQDQLKILTCILVGIALVELTSTEISDPKCETSLIRLALRILKNFNLDMNTALQYYPLAQVCYLSSASHSYNPEASSLRAYSLLTRFQKMQLDIKKDGLK